MENENNQKPPKTYLVESILITLFCCWPLGIPAIINAAKVESKFYAGDINGANEASKKAKKWATWSFGLTLVLLIPYMIFMFWLGAAGGF